MTTLFRPVGFLEMDLILNTGNRRFPERLPEQPFFYPVLNMDYAIEIAKKWNAKDSKSNFVGYVTKFEIDDDYFLQFEPHVVGSLIHQELWVPAEKLIEFNQKISRNITIIDAYYGENYTGISSINTLLSEKNYTEQLVLLNNLKKSNIMDYVCEILSQWKIITKNYFLWESFNSLSIGLELDEKNILLKSIKEILIKNRKWFIKTVKEKTT